MGWFCTVWMGEAFVKFEGVYGGYCYGVVVIY
jgi:hypothetical protein